MKKKSMLSLALSAVMVMMIAFTGFSATKTTSTGPKLDADQTLNLSLSDITTLNSLLVTDTYSITVLNAVMEGLTRNENTSNKDIIKPAGATKWELSKNKLVWTFHLRNNKWSDGKNVTAGDYVYAWQKLLAPKTAASYASFIYCVKGAENYNKGKGNVNEVGVKAVNDTTFQVTLTKPVPYFLQITAFKCLLPLRKDIVEKAGESYGQNPSAMVFNGPFVVEQWIKGSKEVLKKNPKYWDANNVKLQTVNLINIPETETEKKMFESKQIDAISLPDADYLAKEKPQITSGDLTYLERSGPETCYLAFNNKDKQKLLTNANIRKALSLSLQKESMCTNLYKDYYPAYGWIPNSVTVGKLEYRRQVPEPMKAIGSQDPKSLFKTGLKELGLDPNGKYTISFLQRGTTAFKRSLSEYFQDLWETKLGVTVKIDVVSTFGELSNRCTSGDYQITIRDWVADFNDPISFFNVFRTGDPNNTALYSNKNYDSLVAKADVEADITKRIEYEKQAEKLLTATDCAVAPIYYGTKKMLTRSYVKGLQFPVFISSFDFKYAYIQGK